MNQLVLERYNYAETETEGYLFLENERVLNTIERPWVPGHLGGTPFESCIPDGEYQLIPHTRPNGDKVYALVNPDLGVWYQKADRPNDDGRYLCLIHAGNYVDDVVGCIAPGLVRTIYDNRRMVGSSRNAMKQVMSHKHASIIIAPRYGTADE